MYIKIAADGNITFESVPKNGDGDVDMLPFIEKIQSDVGGVFAEASSKALKGLDVFLLCNEAARISNDDLEVNLLASILYGIAEHGHPIFGDVCLVWQPKKKNGNREVQAMSFDELAPVVSLLKYLKEGI